MTENPSFRRQIHNVDVIRTSAILILEFRFIPKHMTKDELVYGLPYITEASHFHVFCLYHFYKGCRL